MFSTVITRTQAFVLSHELGLVTSVRSTFYPEREFGRLAPASAPLSAPVDLVVRRTGYDSDLYEVESCTPNGEAFLELVSA
jgi:hypothetical protein